MSRRRLATLPLVIVILIILLASTVIFFADGLPREVVQPTSTRRTTPEAVFYTPPPLNTRVPVTPSYFGQPVPDTTLQMLDGTSLTLQEYRGKVIVLNFWASWCVPCIEEMPMLADFAARMDEEVVVIALTDPDSGQTLDDVRAFVDTYDLSSLMIGLDEHPGLHEQLGVLGLPSTYFIDRDGIVVQQETGLIDVQLLETTVSELLVN